MHLSITAELASHWRGDFELLDWMVGQCKKIGFDYVKFQAISESRLARHPELDYYRKSSVSKENVSRINLICKSHDMEWYSSVTYPEAVDFLDPYVNIWKIANYDVDNAAIMDRVCSTGKKVILSTPKPFEHNDSRIVNLYCIPRYPTPIEDLNFDMLSKFDGYSCHTPSFRAVLAAVEKGIKYLEIHNTPTKDYFFLDNPVSFSISECYDLIRWVRRFEYWNSNSGKAHIDTLSKQGTRKP